MRLPFSKVYRAFPELDRLTDEQCEEYVRQVRRRFRVRRRTHVLLVFFGTLLAVTLIFAAVVIVLVSEQQKYLRGVRDSLVDHPAALAVFIPVICVGPPLLWMFSMHAAWLNRWIKVHMAEIRCVQCQYLLLGLAVHNDTVACPECGQTIILSSLGLTAADIMGIDSGEQAASVPSAQQPTPAA